MGLLIYLVEVVVLYQAKPDKKSSFLIILRSFFMHYNKIYGLKVLVNRNRLLVCLQSPKERFLNMTISDQ